MLQHLLFSSSRNSTMGLTSLMGFITVMWLMVLATAAFLLFIVPPLGTILFKHGANRLAISVQASLSIAIVLFLIAGLSKMKKIYIKRKLQS
jgi:hypothetical protein